jgi:hypothetical protein
MKTYKLEITIREGNDEYWENVTKDGLSGCDQVLIDVRDQLQDANWQDFDVKLIGYKDE